MDRISVLAALTQNWTGGWGSKRVRFVPLQTTISLYNRDNDTGREQEGYFITGEYNEFYIPQKSMFNRSDYLHDYIIWGYDNRRVTLVMKHFFTKQLYFMVFVVLFMVSVCF